MQNVLGIRLKTARKVKGLSLGDLSLAVNSCVSRQALSKYEHGVMLPSSRNLDAIAKALGVPVAFFHGESLGVDIPMLRTSSQRVLTAQEITELEVVIQYFSARFLHRMNRLDMHPAFDCALKGKKIESIADISEAADSLRNEWRCGDGPIASVLRLLERHGVWVFEYQLPECVLGLSTWVEDKYPVILLDTRKEKTTVERLRFTAAHELGHLLLDFSDGFDQEKMCNKFAGLFLFPKDTFIHEICGMTRKELYLEELIDLHEVYGVSVAALVHQAYDLGVIGRDHYDYWFDSAIKKNPKEQGWGNYLFPETLGLERRLDEIMHNQKISK